MGIAYIIVVAPNHVIFHTRVACLWCGLKWLAPYWSTRWLQRGSRIVEASDAFQGTIVVVKRSIFLHENYNMFNIFDACPNGPSKKKNQRRQSVHGVYEQLKYEYSLLCWLWLSSLITLPLSLLRVAFLVSQVGSHTELGLLGLLTQTMNDMKQSEL